MEDIIVALLFMYPGALVDVLYQRFAKYSYKEDDMNSMAKTAKYFAYSVFITSISVFVYQLFTGFRAETISDIMGMISNLGGALGYLIISVIVTGIFAYVIYYLDHMSPSAVGEDKTLKQIGECEVVNSANAWREIVYGNSFKGILGYCIVRITNGDHICAGFVTYFPQDFEDGIALNQTRSVTEMLNKEKTMKPEHRLIGNPYLCYYDPNSGTFVEFFDGRRFYERLAACADTE